MTAKHSDLMTAQPYDAEPNLQSTLCPMFYALCLPKSTILNLKSTVLPYSDRLLLWRLDHQALLPYIPFTLQFPFQLSANNDKVTNQS